MAKNNNTAPTVLRWPYPAPAGTMNERLDHIEASSQRIHSYVQFMRQVGSLNGASDEVREKAVAAFYERITILERQLGRIFEDLQLA